MKWEGMNLHIENLLPGIVTLVLLMVVLPLKAINGIDVTLAASLFSNVVIGGATFIAASYLAGIFVVALSRCVIDPLSGWLPRRVLFRLSDPDRFRGADSRAVRHAYWSATQRALESGNEYTRSEIKNRRERARLLRSALIPMALFVWTVSGNVGLAGKIFCEVVVLVLGLFLYAYLELAIYLEAEGSRIGAS
jgi:hypothetical protein